VTATYVPGHKAIPRLRVKLVTPIWPLLPGRVQGWLCGCPTCRGEESQPMATYSYCEPVTATGTSPWHIRRLTEAGRKLGGGADTPALCGREVSWDLGGNEVTAESIERINQWPPVVCPSCEAAWVAAVNRTGG
jgi:hypothetical protein